jgi:hypothetical protein
MKSAKAMIPEFYHHAFVTMVGRPKKAQYRLIKSQ